MKVIEIDYGTGNRVEDIVYINKDLKKYPGLYEAVLAHEKQHTGNFTWKDFMLDLINKDIRKVRGQWLRFIYHHPRSWINFSPVMKLEEQWTFDASILAIWSIALIFFGLFWRLL